MKRRSRLTNRPLTLAPPKTAAELKNLDVFQSPDYTVTNTKDNGGLAHERRSGGHLLGQVLEPDPHAYS